MTSCRFRRWSILIDVCHDWDTFGIGCARMWTNWKRDGCCQHEMINSKRVRARGRRWVCRARWVPSSATASQHFPLLRRTPAPEDRTIIRLIKKNSCDFTRKGKAVSMSHLMGPIEFDILTGFSASTKHDSTCNKALRKLFWMHQHYLRLKCTMEWWRKGCCPSPVTDHVAHHEYNVN